MDRRTCTAHSVQTEMVGGPNNAGRYVVDLREQNTTAYLSSLYCAVFISVQVPSNQNLCDFDAYLLLCHNSCVVNG